MTSARRSVAAWPSVRRIASGWRHRLYGLPRWPQLAVQMHSRHTVVAWVGRRVSAAILGMVLGVASSVAPSAAFHADDASWCRYGSGIVRVHLAAQHVVRLVVVDGHIEFADLTDYSYRGRCGRATIWNTDKIRVTETIAGGSRLQFDQQLGRFGPGRTKESSGSSEIEVDLGTVQDVWVMGRSAREVVTVGSRGINLNGDSDADLIGSNLRELTLFLNAGDDVVRASGGRGTGDPFLPKYRGLAVYGGDGADVLYGTSRADVLRGDWGKDFLSGRGGADDLDGGNEPDRIIGGPGNDYIVPGYGADSALAGDGDDFIDAEDLTVDSMDGGVGYDGAHTDSMDQVTGVEY